MEQPVNDMPNLIKQEASTILDFMTGPFAYARQTPYLASWVTGGSPENVAEHGYGVVLTALAIHQLCRARDIVPYTNIDGTRIALQALVGSTQALSNLFAIPLDDNPLLSQLRNDAVPVYIKHVVRELAPIIAAPLTEAWMMQWNTPRNPISQLVALAELTHNIVFTLNTATGGNRTAIRTTLAATRDIYIMVEEIDNDLKYVALGIADTVCRLLNTSAEELLNADSA